MSRGFPKLRTIPRVKESRLSNSWSQISVPNVILQAAGAERTLEVSGLNGITISGLEGNPDVLFIDGSGVSGGAGVTDHGALTGLGDDDHTDYHTDGRADTWFLTKSHTDLNDIGSNTHPQIDTQIASFITHSGDSTIHFIEGDIDHTAIQNIGNNTHAQLDAHVASFITHSGDTSNPHELSLDQVNNPAGNKTFTMSNKLLAFRYTAPTPAGEFGGAFEIEATGGFTGDLLHIHQHTGNPSTVNLLYLEAEDADVCLLKTDGAGTVDAVFKNTIGITALTASQIVKTNASKELVSAATLDHNSELTNVGSITHTQLDTQIASFITHSGDTTLHFTEGSIDHGSIAGLGDDDHSQYHNNTRGDARYYTQAQVTTISGFLQTDIDTKISGDHTHTLSGLTDTNMDATISGQVLTWNGSEWVNQTSGSGVTDHGLLTGLTDNDHTQYYLKGDVDSLITASGVTNGNSHDHSGGDGAQIDHNDLSNNGATSHLNIDTHITGDHVNVWNGRIGNVDPQEGDYDLDELGDVAISTPAAGDHLEYNGASWDNQQPQKDHGALDGLPDDDHTQYPLIAGRIGGQTLNGGNGSGDDLTLNSTTHGTKGEINLGTDVTELVKVASLDASKIVKTDSSKRFVSVAGWLPPPGAVVWCILTAQQKTDNFTSGVGDAGTEYEGWAILDGNGGRPNLDNKFIRADTASSGGTGGSDTQTHPLSTSGGARIGMSQTGITKGATGPSFSYTDVIVGNSSSGSGSFASQGLVGDTDSADNKPAYFALVPLMRL